MKIFEKAKKFYHDHSYEIKTVLTGIAIIGAGYYASKKICDYIYGSGDNANNIVLPDDGTGWTEEVNERYQWSEEKYRETYDRVVEFAKTLPLIDGESYWIDRDDRYNNGEVIVSHMIDGTGVYPDDDEEEDSANEDTV